MTDSPEEREHWRSVIRAFDGYMRYHLSANQARRMAYLSLPKESKVLFDTIGYREKLDAVDEGIRRNAEFIEEMIISPVFADMLNSEDNNREQPITRSPSPSPSDHFHSNSHDESISHSRSHTHTHGNVTNSNSQFKDEGSKTKRLSQAENDQMQDKIRSTIRSFVRDWADIGAPEREACYSPCLDALERYYPLSSSSPSSSSSISSEEEKEERKVVPRGQVNVLVPGCGLGRLAMEIAARGFASQGNEFSSYMLIASHWVLNQTTHRNSHSIYPYLHSFSNHLSTMHNLLLRVQIPDVCPAQVLGNGAGGDFSLVAGDFEEIYGPNSWDSSSGDGGQRGKWGAVVTCFFIDCARNVLNYLRIIHTLLSEDGIWINLGPLLWHYENSPNTSSTGEGSIELSLDEVQELARRVGFQFKESRIIPTTYTGIPDGMLKHEYQAAFWVATKCPPKTD